MTCNPMLIYIIAYSISYIVLYVVLKTIEFNYGTFASVSIGLLLLLVVIVLFVRFITKGDN